MAGAVVRWAGRHAHTLTLLAITAVFVVGLVMMRDLRDQDKRALIETARVEREAALHLCEEQAEQIVLVRDVIGAALQPPPIESYSYIEDLEFRAAVHAQSVKNRAELRDRITEGLTPGDCASQLPPPPDPGGTP